MKSLQTTSLILIATFANFAHAGNSPSGIDCARTTNKAERIICSDKDMAEIDGMLMQSYQSWLSSTNMKEQSAVKQRQLDWMKNERNACNDKACLEKVYDKRFAELSTSTAALGGQISDKDADAAMGAVMRSATKDIPHQLQGIWGDNVGSCRQLKGGLNTDGILTIKPDQLVGYNWKCKLKSGSNKGANYEGQFSCEDDEGPYQKAYLLSLDEKRQLLLAIKGVKSKANPMIACGDTTSAPPQANAIPVRTDKPVSTKMQKVPMVTCSAEDQAGMVDPRTGQMSQRSIDIQMGKVKCR